MFSRIMTPIIAFLIGLVFMGELLDGQIIGPLKARLIDTAITIEILETEVEYLQDTCPESLICYEPYGAPVEAEYVLDGSIVIIKFVDASEMADDEEAYAVYTVDFKLNASICLIVAQFPTHVLGDPIMDSIGHEFLHCIVGDFHP